MKQLTLKAALRRRRMTQAGLAAKAALDKATVSRIAAGKVLNPSHATVAAIERALTLPPGTLVFGHAHSINTTGLSAAVQRESMSEGSAK